MQKIEFITENYYWAGESLPTDIRDVAASRQERSKCHVNNNCLGKCRGGGICLDDGHCICLPQVRRLQKFPKQGGEGPAVQADFDAVLPSASCSYDRECIKRCKDHRGKCINGECICGGGPKQTVLEAILPSAACSRESDCTKFCPPKCGLVICYKGACLCECF